LLRWSLSIHRKRAEGMSMDEAENPPVEADVAQVKVLTCVGIKVLRANGAVEEIREWQSHTPQTEKATS
jgi:hypothetical protein